MSVKNVFPHPSKPTETTHPETTHKQHTQGERLLAKEADENERWSYQSIKHYVSGHKAVDSRSRQPTRLCGF